VVAWTEDHGPEVDVEFETAVDIAAPASRVWDVLADVTAWPSWTASVTSATVLTPEPVAVGSRVKVRQPKMSANTWTITNFEPGTRFTWETGRGGMRIVGDHVIESRPGGSRVTLTLTTSGALAPVIDRLMGSMVRRYVGMEAAGLKSASEGSAAG
jgi:uncharacterized membrane protein